MHAVQMLAWASAACLVSAPATAMTRIHPMQFFEGRTEGNGTMKILMKKPYRTKSIGVGHLLPDGTLSLVQRVNDDGKSPRERRWQIRRISDHRFSGTMSEAIGPVTIEEIDGRYRFRFRMKGNISVEQWLTPLDGGTSARQKMTVRKLGMIVGTGEGIIRRLDSR